MEKFLLGIKKRLLCIVLSVSMVCSTTAATTYQAAAIPVVYTAWEVFGIIFTLLGISLACLDTIEAKQQAVEELEDKFVGWKVLKGEGQGDNDGDGQDDLYAAFDIMDYLDGDKLVIPDEDLQDFKDFYQDNMAPPVAVHPIDNTDIKKLNYQEFCDWFKVFFPEYADWSGSSSFMANMYDKLAEYDYSGVVFGVNDFNPFRIAFDALTFYDKSRPVTSFSFGYRETSNGGRCNFQRFYLSADGSSLSGGDFLRDKNLQLMADGKGYKNDWYAGANTGMSAHSGNPILCFIVNGKLYEPSVFTKPINSTTSLDFGSLYSYSDFVKSVNNLSDNFTDEVGTIGGVDLSDKIQDGTFDVIGDGRDYDSDKKDTYGTITVPMPSGDVITDYQNGLISYEEFLDELGVVPIDKATGTNLFTQEFLDTQTGILSGVDKLVNFVGGIWDFLVNGLQGILNGIAETIQAILAFLNNLVSSLVQALLDMLTSLFVPSEGYFEAYFTKLDSFLTAKLGVLYLPIDLLIDILNAFVSADKSDTTLHFPGIIYQEYVIVPEQDVNLDVSGRFPFLQTAAHFISSAILTFGLIMQLRSKLREVLKR